MGRRNSASYCAQVGVTGPVQPSTTRSENTAPIGMPGVSTSCGRGFPSETYSDSGPKLSPEAAQSIDSGGGWTGGQVTAGVRAARAGRVAAVAAAGCGRRRGRGSAEAGAHRHEAGVGGHRIAAGDCAGDEEVDEGGEALC